MDRDEGLPISVRLAMCPDERERDTSSCRESGLHSKMVLSIKLSQIQDSIRCFRGPLSRVPRRTLMVRCSEAPIRCFRAPHTMFLEASPIVYLEHPVLTCMRLIYLYYDSGSFRAPILSYGCFAVPNSMA